MLHRLALLFLLLPATLMPMMIPQNTVDKINLFYRKYSPVAVIWNEKTKTWITKVFNRATGRYEKRQSVSIQEPSVETNPEIATKLTVLYNQLTAPENYVYISDEDANFALTLQWLVPLINQPNLTYGQCIEYGKMLASALTSPTLDEPLKHEALKCLYILATAHKNLPALRTVIAYHTTDKLPVLDAKHLLFLCKHITLSLHTLPHNSDCDKLIMDTAILSEHLQDDVIGTLKKDAQLYAALCRYQTGIRSEERWMVYGAWKTFYSLTDSPMAQLYATALALKDRCIMPEGYQAMETLDSITSAPLSDDQQYGDVFEYIKKQLEYLETALTEETAYHGLKIFQDDLELLALYSSAPIRRYALSMLHILARAAHIEPLIEKYKQQYDAAMAQETPKFRPELTIEVLTYEKPEDLIKYVNKIDAVIANFSMCTADEITLVKQQLLDYLLDKSILPQLDIIFNPDQDRETACNILNCIFKKCHPRTDQVDQFLHACIPLLEQPFDCAITDFNTKKIPAALYVWLQEKLSQPKKEILSLASYKLINGYLLFYELVQEITKASKGEAHRNMLKVSKKLNTCLAEIEKSTQGSTLESHTDTLKNIVAQWYQFYATECCNDIKTCTSYFDYALQLCDPSAELKNAIALIKKIECYDYDNSEDFSLHDAKELFDKMLNIVTYYAVEKKSQRAYKELVSIYRGHRIDSTSIKKNSKSLELFKIDLHRAYKLAKESYALGNYSRRIPLDLATLLSRGPQEIQNHTQALAFFQEAIETSRTHKTPLLDAYYERALLYIEMGNIELATQDIDQYLSLRKEYPDSSEIGYEQLRTALRHAATLHYTLDTLLLKSDSSMVTPFITYWIPIFHKGELERIGIYTNEPLLAEEIEKETDAAIISKLCTEARHRMTQGRTDQESLDLCYLVYLITCHLDDTPQKSNRDLLSYAAVHNYTNAQLLLTHKRIKSEELDSYVHSCYQLYKKQKTIPGFDHNIFKQGIVAMSKEGYLTAQLYEVLSTAEQNISYKNLISFFKKVFHKNKCFHQLSATHHNAPIVRDIQDTHVFQLMQNLFNHFVTHKEVDKLAITSQEAGYALIYYATAYMSSYFHAYKTGKSEEIVSDYLQQALAALSLVIESTTNDVLLRATAKTSIQVLLDYTVDRWLLQGDSQEYRAALLKQATTLSHLKLAAMYIFKDKNITTAKFFLDKVAKEYATFTFNCPQHHLIHQFLLYMMNKTTESGQMMELFKNINLKKHGSLLLN